LTQRFDNSAEYALEDDDLDIFIGQLQESGHFLVYTKVFEERGTYIMADGSLWNNPSAVRQLLQRSFSIGVPTLRGGVDENREPPIDENIPEAGEIHATSSVGDHSDVEEDLAGFVGCGRAI
jgi:mitogen-activated protein kinase kinase kinase